MNEMKKMKTLTLQGIPFEVVDEAARNEIEDVKETLNNLPENEVTTPDLAQNDPSASDYVKNRTHWSEVGTAQRTYNFTNGILSMFPSFSVGDTVTVTVDDTEYSLVAYEEQGFPCIGDTWDALNAGTGEYGWRIYIYDNYVWFYAAEKHTVKCFTE